MRVLGMVLSFGGGEGGEGGRRREEGESEEGGGGSGEEGNGYEVDKGLDVIAFVERVMAGGG